MPTRFKRHQAAIAVSPFQPLTPHGQKLLHLMHDSISHMHSLIEGCIRETNGTTYLVHLVTPPVFE